MQNSCSTIHARNMVCFKYIIVNTLHKIIIIIIIIIEVTANRPDIIIKNKKEKTCTLIDVAIPANRHVVQKEAEKKLKYKNFTVSPCIFQFNNVQNTNTCTLYSTLYYSNVLISLNYIKIHWYSDMFRSQKTIFRKYDCTLLSSWIIWKTWRVFYLKTLNLKSRC